MRWFAVDCTFTLWALAVGISFESGSSAGSRRLPHFILVIGPISMAIGPNADQII